MLEQISGNAARFMIYALAILSILLIFLAIYYLINIGNRYIDGKKRINIDLRLITKIFLGILIFYLINIIFNKFPILGYTLSSVIIAIIFAYIIDPIVNYLERKGVKRQFGVIIVYISAILIFGILIVSVIPKTINEISNLLTSLPAMVDTLIREVNNFASNVFAKFNIELPENFINVYKETNPKVNGDVETPQIVSDILNSIKATINDLIVKAQGSLMGSLSNVLSKLYGFLTSAFRLVLIIIFSFYFSVDKDRFMHRVKKAIPNKYRDDISYLTSNIDTALQQFIRGRMLMAIFVGLITMAYLLVLRVDFAIIIGLITCVADIIPYIGPFLGCAPAVLFAFMDSPMKALWVLILFVIVQWVENNILAPKLIGDSTGLNPLVILISIIIGGGIFGVWGMVISVPLMSIIFILVDFIKIKYNDRYSSN
ncbi:pheromone autoinducer 2 transporter [Peptoniphilus harei]|uniref:Pheromone autoinducer 2 transporter n=3 Tax=Peptoniphilus harei TaxID=54005 RepID=A0A2X1Y4F2_9FIRM|nr:MULTISPECIES: AI-2E family transporter [Peptoniphilus]MDU1642280.1 AI-2E family transporter [Peptoniphilus harei]MDU5470740.1 AI-2E family transporter [Peptoniphilus harei]MDU6098384.1 AI-2E family transporter [Peptoniphilus harei]OFO62295.1 AI-2E family transporter [Peptoniphilus sp. HMSC075B08]QQE47061.1 AI-2E family transporter [Peptoniphilus harei]